MNFAIVTVKKDATWALTSQLRSLIGYKSREACLQEFVHRIDRSDDANAALVEVLAALKLSSSCVT